MKRSHAAQLALMGPALLGLILGGLAPLGCKLEPVLDLEPDPAARVYPQPPPIIPEAVPFEEDRSHVRAEVSRQLTALAGPALAGRRPGTEGAAATVDWLETSMRQIGLIPDGVGGGWQQPVVVRLDVTVDGRISLPRAMEDEPPDVLSHGQELILWRDGRPGSWSGDRAIVEAGHGIAAPELGHDDYAEIDVKGKVVLLEGGLPPALQEAEELPKPYDTLAYKFTQAKLAGAVGVLVTTEALAGEPRWKQLRGRFGKRQPGELDDPVLVASTGLDVAGMVSAEGEAALRTWIGATALRAAAGVAAKPAQLTIETEAQTVVAANVVGRVPGDVHPEEVVVVMAHWDAGGTSEALADGGALTDNASGVAAMLGVARMVVDRLARGDAPHRSIVFAATASDTLSLSGAKMLVSSGPLSSAKLIAVVSLDALLVEENEPKLGSIDAEAAGLADVLDAVEQSFETIPVERAPHRELGHRPSLEAGVPAITLTRHDPSTPAVEGPINETTLGALVDDVVATFDVVWRLSTTSATPTTRADDPPPAPDVVPAPATAPEEPPPKAPKPQPEPKPEPKPKPKPQPSTEVPEMPPG